MKRTTHQDCEAPRTGNAYLDWALVTGFRYARAGRWLPLLVEFEPKALPGGDPAGVQRNDGGTPVSVLQIFVQLEWLDARVRTAVRVPELFADPKGLLASQGATRFCLLLVDRQRAREVFLDSGWRNVIVDLSLGPPLDLPADLIAPAPMGFWDKVVNCLRRLLGLPPLQPDSPSVADRLGPLPADFASRDGACAPHRAVVAVIDEGIAFAHERFRAGLSTRVEHYWNQNSLVGSSLGTSTPGIDLDKSQIDAALAAHSAGQRVEEDALYQALGIVDMSSDGFKPLMNRRAHGTAVLDLAAGRDAGEQDGPPIIAVELPVAAVADPVGTPLYPFIAMGMVYVLFRANQMRADGECLPVVLNLSYGPHHGPHDGKSLFERFVEFLVGLSQSSWTPLAVVLAGGNFRQGRVHAHVAVPAGDTKQLAWRVQPEDVTPNLVELWLPPGAEQQITVTVTSPLGETVTVSAADPQKFHPDAIDPVFFAEFVMPTAPQPRASVVVAMQGTATDPPLQPGLPTAQPGIWQIDIANSGDAGIDVESWIWRDGRGTRRSPGRQSYFDDPAYKRFHPTGIPLEYDLGPPSYVQRKGTLSGIATGASPIVVGGFRRLDSPPEGEPIVGTPAAYSSMGPVSSFAARVRPDPDLLVPSEDSVACKGVLAAGTHSGSTIAMNGTSVAAPRLVRFLADWIATNGAFPPKLPALDAPTFIPPNTPPVGDIVYVAGNGLFNAPPSIRKLEIKRR